DDIKLVATAAAVSQHYADAELVLAEWGPPPDMFSNPTYGTSMDLSLLATAVIALGSAVGLDRAHHSFLWDFYPLLTVGLLDHDVRPRPLYYAYTLLHALITTAADRLAPLNVADGRLDGGAAAVLVGKDGSGVIRVLFVNRSDVSRTG